MIIKDSYAASKSLTYFQGLNESSVNLFTHSREIMKAGIIYVGLGQEDQNEILKNESGSELYSEFVKGMGWMVLDSVSLLIGVGRFEDSYRIFGWLRSQFLCWQNCSILFNR